MRAADPLVLFAGRLIPEKRVTLGVAAVARAARQIEGLRGVFYGDGPEREALRRRRSPSTALQAIVSAPGFADAGLVDADMRRALCMLLPSRREGYGMVVVEASAHATPSIVVAGEDNAATELVEDGVNGVVVASAGPRGGGAGDRARARGGIWRCARARLTGSPRMPSTCRWSPRWRRSWRATRAEFLGDECA